ncbi:hypothetical protein G6F31_015026 [Rhizopus arrhizus]|nr:hypothetical protein G6F31_015026 [Rhizopus arrhizus]
MEWLRPILEEWARSGRDYVLCGDWNIVRSALDIKNWKSNQKNSGCLPEERDWLNALCADHGQATDVTAGRGWADAYRLLNPTGEDYTWWSNRGAARANNVAARSIATSASPTTRRSSWTTTCDRGRHAGQLQGLGRHQARLRHSVGADHGHARLRQRPAVPADRLADPVHAPARRRPGPGQHRPDQPGQLLLPAHVPVGAPAGSLCLPAARWARPPPLVAAGVAGAGAGRPGRTGLRASRAGRLAAGGLGAGGLVRRCHPGLGRRRLPHRDRAAGGAGRAGGHLYAGSKAGSWPIWPWRH